MDRMRQWLEGLALGQYAEAFAASDIDLEVLPELGDQDLKELGLSLGHRKKLLKAIAALRQADAPTEPGRAATAALRSEAERRQLTVMFSDLVGSTALSAQLDPEDMREVIRAYQNTAAGEITRFEGHVGKYMGDGVLAYFGYPRAHEDEAERAVRAGLALVAAVARLRTPTDQPLAARIGIATGLVVVGDLVGEGAAREQAVVGDTPNLAARLQGVAQPGQVVIADATRRLLGERFELIDLGPQALKGIAEPVQAFAVTGERAVQSRFEARRGQLLPMVGRNQELALLLERWAQANAGEGQGVLLIGEAGIGKSRITRALLDVLAEKPHTRIRYQCSPYHADSALWPVVQQLTHAAGFATADPTETRLDKLSALLDRAGGHDAAPLIANLLGVDGGTRYGKLDLTPEAQRARTLAALVDQLVGLAARQPVLVVLEDAHWVDPTTLELIEQCLDRIADRRVLILLTSRPDHQPTLAGHPHVTRLTLNRLGRAGVEAIVAQLSGGSTLPAATIDTIIARTDGVPLFVEELTKAILEVGETSIPASLHDSLMARLDRIPEVKEVAQIAACIGREFDHALFAAVADRSEPDLQSALDKLAAAELIFRRGTPPDAHYTFKHALVQDAAYQSLLKSRRQLLHGRIFAVLEQDFAETAPELLAAHASEAGRVEQAIDYWEQAGQAAYERAAHKEAIAHYRAALDLVAKTPDTSLRHRVEARLLTGLGSPTGMLVGFGAAEAEEIWRRALAACDHESDPGSAAAALEGLCNTQHCRGDERAANETAQQELADAERDGSWGAIQAAYCDLGSCLCMLGEFSAACEALRRVSGDHGQLHETRARLTGKDPRVYASTMEAVALWHLGMPDTALSSIEAAEVLGSQSPRPFDQVMPVCFVAKIRLLRREYAEARQHAERAVRLAEERGVVHFHYDGLLWLGWALAGLDAIDEGLDAIRRGIEWRRAIGAFVAWPLFLLVYAYALHRGGRSDLALDNLDEAVEWTRRGGDRHWLAEIHRRRGTIALVHGRSDIDPEAELLRALEVARSQSARSQELRAATSLARLWCDQGKRTEACDLLAPVYAWFTEGFDTPDLNDAKALLDDLGSSAAAM